MAFSRRFGVVGLVGACWFVAVGCGDDDKKTSSGDAGEGGEAGDGSSKSGSSPGGSSNVAGKGGTTPVGLGGDGGAAGAGRPAGGAGGEAGQTPRGEGGAMGGSAGEGGEGGAAPAIAKQCASECETHDDCMQVDGPSLQCNELTKRCEDPALVCQAHEDCVPAFSQWFAGCTSDDSCFGGEVCIDWNGTGYCAPRPDGDFGCLPYTAITAPPFGGGEDVQVCSNSHARCDSGACIVGCSDFGCPTGKGDTCNEASGLCECTVGTECDSGVCGADSRCDDCVTSQDCADRTDGLDTCVNGTCGCGTAASCPNPGFTGATSVCE